MEFKFNFYKFFEISSSHMGKAVTIPGPDVRLCGNAILLNPLNHRTRTLRYYCYYYYYYSAVVLCSKKFISYSINFSGLSDALLARPKHSPLKGDGVSLMTNFTTKTYWHYKPSKLASRILSLP
jgi:hypothetical protein